MANPSKAKGTKFEREVVEFIKTHGFVGAERRALGGSLDRGDVSGVPGFVFECKATRAIDLATAVDEAKREAAVEDDFPIAVVKRRMKPTGEAYFVTTLERGMDLVWVYDAAVRR